MITVMLLVVLAEEFHNPGRDWTHWGHSESESEMKTHKYSLLTLEGQKDRLTARRTGRVQRTSLFLGYSSKMAEMCICFISLRRLMGRASRMRQAVVSGERRMQKHGLGTEFLHVS